MKTKQLFPLALLAGLLLGTSLHAQIFVTNVVNGTIGEYTISGSTVNAALVSGLSDPDDIALSGSDIFVVNEGITGSIGEYTTSGSTVNASLIPSLYEPGGIALSGSDIFIVEGDSTTGFIGEYTTSGSLVNASLVSGLSLPSGIAVSGSNIFVANYGSNTIGEYTTSGSTVNTALVSGLDRPVGFTISGSDIFVGNFYDGAIDVYTTSGSLVNAFFGGANPSGIAVSGSDVFVSSPYTEAVGEYTTTGGTVSNPLFTDSNNPYGIVVIPEPSTWVMLIIGGTGLLFAVRRRSKTKHLVLPALFAGLLLGSSIKAQAQNLFVSNGGSIHEYTPGGTQTTFASGLEDAHGLAFNSAGDLFEADYQTNNIYEFTPGGARTTFASGVDDAAFLAFQGEPLPIPEPSTWAMLAISGAFLLILARRKGAARAYEQNPAVFLITRFTGWSKGLR